MPRNIVLLTLLLAGWLTIVLVSCKHLLPEVPPDNQLLDGPIAGLTPTQNRLFLEGDRAFNEEVFMPATGLGPVFVATSCGSCHAGDGKGTPFTTLTRFGRLLPDGDFDHLLGQGGPQLQHRAIPGYEAEQIPAEATGIARFMPPANTGLGFLEAVPDSELLRLADPTDQDGDGISGTVNWIDPADYHFPSANRVVDTTGRYIGRFGKKAGTINLLQQTVVAYKQDMGITTDFDTRDIFNHSVGSGSVDAAPDPEVSAATVENVVFYLRTLKAPIPRNQNAPEVLAGKALFRQLDCGKCHQPTLQTGHSDIAALSNREFHPYTDLLLHDMGSGLDDGYTEGTAQTAEWKTPPLWGLGLSPNSQGGKYFLMHDGRAKSIEEAILLHGGEAIRSQNKYQSLSQTEKNQLLTFLKSL